MASLSTKKLKVTELDFDLIKDSLKSYLRSQDQFTDYDFEGSGLSVLLDLLAYNTHYNAFYTNMVANEMFLDSATLRDSVVSLAKQLGYTPRSVTSARAHVNVTFTPNDLGGLDLGTQSSADLLGTNVIIPKGSVFISEIENKAYSFVTTKSYTATGTANASGGFLLSTTVPTVVPYTAIDIELVQGVYASSQYVYNSQLNKNFTIPNADVDISTITVLVTDAISGTTGTIYTLNKDYTELNSSSTVFFLQETRNGKYEIYFGDGNIGKKPSDGNIIDVTYVVSGGDGGNGATVFNADPIKSPTYNGADKTRTYVMDVSTTINATGGGDREDIESIKYLAPRNFESQNRAVTTNDYVVNLISEYPQLDAVHCWGGEENDPPNYGKVYLSVKPKEGYVLADAEKENIKKNILKSRNIVTVDPIIVDPDYIYLIIDSVIKWDSRLTPLSSSILKIGVRDLIIQWGQNNLERFETYFRYSSLLFNIDNFNDGIVNNETTIKLRKEIVPLLGVYQNISFNFGNPLFHPHSGHRGTLTSTSFAYANHTGCRLKDNEGVLEIYGSSASGQNILLSSDAGTINYDTGKVDLIGFSPTAVEGGIISIIVLPSKQDIVPQNNQLITINESDLTVKMVDDSSVLTGTLQTTRVNVGSSGAGSTGSSSY